MSTDTGWGFFGMSSLSQKINFRMAVLERLQVAINLIYNSQEVTL